MLNILRLRFPENTVSHQISLNNSGFITCDEKTRVFHKMWIAEWKKSIIKILKHFMNLAGNACLHRHW